VHIEPVLDELAYAVRDRDTSLADSRRADAWLTVLADAQPAFTEATLRDWLADRLQAIETGAGATDE
jgi:hypothetical protein